MVTMSAVMVPSSDLMSPTFTRDPKIPPPPEPMPALHHARTHAALHHARTHHALLALTYHAFSHRSVTHGRLLCLLIRLVMMGIVIRCRRLLALRLRQRHRTHNAQRDQRRAELYESAYYN